MVTLSPKSDSNVSKTLSLQNGNRVRDVSFSSFLDGSEETFILKLSESHFSTDQENIFLDTKKAEDNEIDVFNAEKYFNERVEDESPAFASKTIIHGNENPELELYQMKQQIRCETPSVSSKSSLNSRSSLLHRIPRNDQSQKTNWFNRKRFFSKLGCNCSDKNSVEIDDHVGRNVYSNSSSRRGERKNGDLKGRIEHQRKAWVREEMQSRGVRDVGIEISHCGEEFRFPMVKSNGEGDDDGRKSLEVFGSPILRSRNPSGISVERSLKLLTWDAIDMEENPANPNVMYNDSDSDASSDLFEIESLSTNPSQYLTRQTSDGVSRTTCYAPSEASIDWSVITASAADFSMMSDSEDLRNNSKRFMQCDLDKDGNGSGGGDSMKRRPKIMSGCYSHKAVMVAGDAHRVSEKVLTQKRATQV